MTDPTPRPSWLTRVTGVISALSTNLALLVGLPSTVYTWTSQASERATALAVAVEQEEARWNKLYDQYYLALADRRDSSRMALAEARYQALCRLVFRKASDFSAYPLGGFWPDSGTQRHIASREQIERLRHGLVSMLLNPATSSDEAARCMQQQHEDRAADSTAARERDDAPATSAAPTTPPPVVTEAVEQTHGEVVDASAAHARPTGKTFDVLKQLASVTLSAGQTDGWDVDVFWCEGPKSAANLALADSVARALGLGDARGTKIGRVRLRMLSTVKQAESGYRPVGLEVRGEVSESAAARAIAAALSGEREGTFRVRPSAQVTPWYVSAFVCR